MSAAAAKIAIRTMIGFIVDGSAMVCGKCRSDAGVGEARDVAVGEVGYVTDSNRGPGVPVIPERVHAAVHKGESSGALDRHFHRRAVDRIEDEPMTDDDDRLPR